MSYRRYDRIDPETTSTSWYTPKLLFDRLGLSFDLDVCAPPGGVPWIPAKQSFSLEDDGLSQMWDGRVWCNPPYGPRISQWMDRMAEHGDGLALVFARSDAAWFHRALKQADAVCFIRGRVRFIRGADMTQPPGNSPAPSVVFAYGTECVAALMRAGLGPTLLVPRLPLRQPEPESMGKAA
jgi:hypothetical protein